LLLDLHPFPTRRSSDLGVDPAKCLHFLWFPCYRHIASLLIKIYADDLSRPLIHPVYPVVRQIHDSKVRNVTFLPRLEWNWVDPRSEEHTSELQSPDHLV